MGYTSVNAGFSVGFSITLWLLENGPFIDGLPIINCDFPWLC
jgi:hypothetical protein